MGRKKIRVKRRSARGGEIRGKELELEEDESGVILSTKQGKSMGLSTVFLGLPRIYKTHKMTQKGSRSALSANVQATEVII